jgi:curli production assembly/transport component CsgF
MDFEASTTIRRRENSSRRRNALARAAVVGLLVVMSAGNAVWSGELVYKPINPNFGGNPFNDGILLGTANAQNQFEAPREPDDPTARFVQTLQNRLFSGLARQVQDAIFGTSTTAPQDSGTFTVGDQEVSFVRGLEVITLEISNLADGSTTVVEVPVVTVE